MGGPPRKHFCGQKRGRNDFTEDVIFALDLIGGMGIMEAEAKA